MVSSNAPSRTLSTRVGVVRIVATAIPAASPGGKPYVPVEIAGNATTRAPELVRHLPRLRR